MAFVCHVPRFVRVDDASFLQARFTDASVDLSWYLIHLKSHHGDIGVLQCLLQTIEWKNLWQTFGLARVVDISSFLLVTVELLGQPHADGSSLVLQMPSAASRC